VVVLLGVAAEADAAGTTSDLRHILAQVHAVQDGPFATQRRAVPTSGGVSLARAALR
jgi:hypothetical protein